MAFYATVRELAGRRTGVLAGPYITHGAAVRASQACERLAAGRPDVAFAGFGTSRARTRADVERLGPGRWNDHIGPITDRLP